MWQSYENWYVLFPITRVHVHVYVFMSWMGKLIIYELNVEVDFLIGFVLTGHAKRMDHVQEGKKVQLTKKLNVFICILEIIIGNLS